MANQLRILDANPVEHEGKPYVLLDRGDEGPPRLIPASLVSETARQLDAAGEHEIAQRIMLARDIAMMQFDLTVPAKPS